MLDGQWELTYGSTVLTLGSSPAAPPHVQRGYHHAKAPAIGDPDLRPDDSDLPRADGVGFGQDFRGGRTITFELGLRGDSADDVLALAGGLLSAWRADAVRSSPGSVAALSTSNGGRLRTVYGRPRRASADHTVPRSAYMLAGADFRTVDDLFYETAPSASVLSLVAPPTGGFKTPVKSPLTTMPSTTTYGRALVAGNARCYPVITFRGPVSRPSVTMDSQWTVSYAGSIAAGVSVEVDCRPWRSTVLSSSGGSLAGLLDRATRLDACWMEPGLHNLALRGTDPTTTCSATIAWQAAYVSI